MRGVSGQINQNKVCRKPAGFPSGISGWFLLILKGGGGYGMGILKRGWLRCTLSMILLLGIILLIFSCRSTNRMAVISKEDALKDYDAMWEILEENYPFFL